MAYKPSLPVISWVQKIALYETKARLFIVGSNNTETRFRVLKIDRTEAKELNVIDDKVEYSQQEIRDMLMRIDVGNRHKSSSSGLNRTISAFGIVGFIRFLEGYYLILITKRRRVAQIGCHSIYKIEDTSMIYIPNEFDKSNYDEVKYVKMFKNVDLSSNFYFSYSYDLTHTLQYNMTPLVLHKNGDIKSNLESNRTVWEIGVDSADNDEPFCGGVRNRPIDKFVWNYHLLKSVDLHSDWIIYICHGFVGQNNISVFGRPLYLTLIARRSQKYAGTRFLKRGANCEGDVANEVESEQIVHDSSVSSFKNGFYTSFVQMRGSIPSHWSQDISKMVPKPTIAVDIVDPYCEAASRHFNQLLYRYGSPIIVLNLVKKREQKPHESVLSNEFISTVDYLNQFLPPRHQINYIGFDMARINKIKNANVMSRLSHIAYHILKANGIFQSKATCLNNNNIRSYIKRDKRFGGGYRTAYGSMLQTGIVRVNCVDCLDRTNTAQFALGKVALAFQLYALGVLNKPELQFETDTVRMLEELYEDHGDTLALQYGGSQLVHRIKTYRKIAPLSSHSRDIMQTLSRYYSNAFSDANKQNVMNLFLGIYEANKSLPIWDLSTDFYLHHSLASGKIFNKYVEKKYTNWCSDDLARCLPRAAIEVYKGNSNSIMCVLKDYGLDERTDGYYEQYRPYELTVFTDTLAFNILHTCKDFMPNFTADYSPFCIRVRPGKRRESLMGSSGSKLPPPNPSVSGYASTSSTSSSASELESESDEDDQNNDIILGCDNSNLDDTEESRSSPFRTFDSMLTNSKLKYGKLVATPRQSDLELYSNYIDLKINSDGLDNTNICSDNKIKPLAGSVHIYNTISVKPPAISENSLNIYQEYIKRGQQRVVKVSNKSLDMYQNYINNMKLTSI